MIPKGCELDILRRLAEMPFLDRLELVALCHRSRSAVYGSMDRLAERGMVQAIPHASELNSPTRRYCLTVAGLERLAELEGASLEDLLASRPVSDRWRRALLERLDALAVIYRVAASFPHAQRGLKFRWYRSGAIDAGIILPGSRTLAMVRMGNAADRTAFAKRLWRLSQEERPGVVLLLAPDEVRLRQVSRMLDNLPLLGFLALEGDAAAQAAGGEFPHLARSRQPGAPGPPGRCWSTFRPAASCRKRVRPGGNHSPTTCGWTFRMMRASPPTCCPSCSSVPRNGSWTCFTTGPG